MGSLSLLVTGFLSARFTTPLGAMYAARWPDLDVRPVDDVNHYTIVLSRRGGAAIADAVRDLSTA